MFIGVLISTEAVSAMRQLVLRLLGFSVCLRLNCSLFVCAGGWNALIATTWGGTVAFGHLLTQEMQGPKCHPPLSALWVNNRNIRREGKREGVGGVWEGEREEMTGV